MQFIRLLAFAMALAIANLPVVWAEPDVRDVVNNPAFLSKYVADAKLKKGSCAINYWGSLLSIPGEQPIQSINGFWPYTDKCADLAPSSGLIYSTGTEPAGSGQIIIRTSEAHQPELSGQLSLFLSWYKKENRAGRQDFHHYRSQWYASATPTPLVNQPITSGSNQAIFGLGWFGEEIDVTFSDSTLYPTTITKFTADRGGGFGQDDAFWKKYVEGKGGSLSMNTDSGFAWGDAAALTGVAAATAAAATVVYTAAAIMLTTATTFAPLGPIGWIVIGAVAVVTFVLGGTTKMYQDTNRFTSTLSTIPNTIIPYTLPSTFQCTGYSIELLDSINGFGNVAKKPMSPSTGGYRFTNGNPTDSIIVDLATDANGGLKSIKLKAQDLSDAGGGFGLVIYCDGVKDPDVDKVLCQSNTKWQWSQAVNDLTSGAGVGKACCGDDGDSDSTAPNNAVDGYVCKKDATGKFAWEAPNALCPGANQFLPGTGCCDATKRGTIVSTATDMHICAQATTGAPYAWAQASTANAPIAFWNGTATKSAASNGQAWLICGDTETRTAGTAATGGSTGTPTLPNSGPTPAVTCTVGTTCTALTNCINSCDTDTAINGPTCKADPNPQTGLGQTCGAWQLCKDVCTNLVATGVLCGTCTNPALVCSIGSCMCPAGQQYVAASATCTPSTSAPSTSTGKLGIEPVCSVTKNAALTPSATLTVNQFRCAGNAWIADDAANVPVFSRGTQTPPQYVTPPATGTTPFYTCDANNRPVATPAKLSPDRGTSSVCGSTQCYYTVSASSGLSGDPNMAGKCVPTDTWIRDDYCTNGLWTSRTQLLANDLASSFSNGYVIHCDKAPASINKPAVMQGFSTTPTVPRINTLCVAQGLGTTPLRVVVGATLNNDLGRNTGAGFTAASAESVTLTSTVAGLTNKPFVAHINDSKLAVDTTEFCNQANNWAELDIYANCPVTAGSAVYNPLIETVAFGTQNSLQLTPNRAAPVIAPRITTSVKPLNGYRVYSYKNPVNGKQVDGVWQREGSGSGNADPARDVITVVYTAGTSGVLNPTGIITAKYGTNPRVRVSTSAPYVVTVTSPTADDWKYLTLQLRP